MAKREHKETKEICGQTFYTIWGMCKQIPGRTSGSHITRATLLQYVKEGCPCFEHAGTLYFNQDLKPFMQWLVTRQPERQRKALERAVKYR